MIPSSGVCLSVLLLKFGMASADNLAHPNSYLISKVNYRVLKGAASHVIAKTCITDM
jgi:hypothetical protein